MFEQSGIVGTRKLPGTRETVALLAGLMALNAFAIDAMIPALPAIGAELGVETENRRQLVVVAYFLGFGFGQIFWGPLADRFGRKPILGAGVALYTGFALLCGIAESFTLLIAGRIAMGASAAVTRVLVTAMVRDLFEGEAMARVMSLVFMVFMLVPVLAPNIGQAILLVGPWRTIFLVLASYGVTIWLWSFIRLPETLHPEYRRDLNTGEIWQAVKTAASDRLSIGYTLALTAVFGGLTAYISSIQQIVFDVFDAANFIGLVFAAIAAPMALASWGNASVVGRFGLRRTGHSGLLAFVTVATAHVLIAELTVEPLWLFIVMMALTFVAFAFTTSNFGTLAMRNMAPIAGTASSFQGVTGTIGGALIGLTIGQSFDGTQLPFLAGLAVCGATALVLVLWTERGRLFGGIDPQIERAEVIPPPEL
ncbi:multidrug effflux MFS transporter [Sphingomonas sp. G124]|uniref:Multidrug effflux MFS transporter n=1 Tax=Sphingomonas cremea TaxID=2904799 RepID=A0A9X1TWG2_9SPHN|nr:multidrug effflux MFS transporter [Sphingomonas cremea]MCF2514045.1 multidrug effflux MFS transporter [Sphingomonas cremea]